MLTIGRDAIIILLVCLSIIGNLMNSSEAKINKPRMRLYYVIPFTIETYIPITKENVEENSYTIWFMEEHQFISELLTILKARPKKAEILLKGIRLKVDFGELGGVFFVDRNGIVLHEGTKATFSVSTDEIEQLEQRLQYFVGIVDIKAFERSKKTE